MAKVRMWHHPNRVALPPGIAKVQAEGLLNWDGQGHTLHSVTSAFDKVFLTELFDGFYGKRVRVTLEVIDDETTEHVVS